MKAKIIFLLFVTAYASQLNDLPRLPLYIGRGYNLLHGNPLSDAGVDPGFNHQIVEFTYNKQEKTEDGKYLLPDDISKRKTTSCSFSTEISEFRGTQSYQKELKTKTEVSGGYNGPLVKASFSTSFSYEKIKNQTTMTNMTVTHAYASCQYYEMSINLFKTNKLSDNFVAGVLYSYKQNDWRKFINQFGTHFIFEVVMGGRAFQEIEYSYKSVSEMESLQMDIHIAAKASFAKFFADSSFDYHKYEKEISYAETLSHSINLRYLGGKPSANMSLYDWQKEIINDPMPITYKVLPLSDLFDDITESGFDKRAATESFYKGIDAYCQENNCKPPTPDHPKPKPATVAIQKAQSYGGGGGGPYEWKQAHPTLSATEFLFRTGKEIDNIQVTLSDGVTTVVSPKFGGTGGGEKEVWKVPKGEHVSQVEYRSGDRIDSITFITDKGTRSPKYGGNGGGYHMVQFPAGARIIGLYGRQGSRLDALGFILGITNTSTGEQEIIKKNLISEQ